VLNRIKTALFNINAEIKNFFEEKPGFLSS